MALLPRPTWVQRIVLLGGVAGMLAWLPLQVYQRSGLAHLIELRRELRGLRAECQALVFSNARLRAEVALYEEDPGAAVERAAREELGLVKPGEVVFRLEPPPAAALATPAPAVKR